MEKSRVVKLNSSERNYHVFYQFLKGADRRMKEEFLVGGLGVEDFTYTRDGNHIIAGVSDTDEWRYLIEAFQVMGFSNEEQKSVIRTVAAVLLLGNVTIMKESLRADQASLTKEAYTHAEKFCRLLGIPLDQFIQGLLHPKVKAGREWVEKVQTPEQVRSSLDALSKGIYERAFGDLVTRINHQLDRTGMGLDDSHFIGVLDIAGFEIFEENSFEQLCINYTNEKLQQFFNHHMFVLEQEEYAREQIEWKFIDFGKDLQPTIDLIELPNPIGIFSCLDEDSVMPKATDKSFTDKMHSLWDRKTPKYKASRLAQGFVLIHYAAEVEYSTSGWLEKNKDPLNDNVTRLLASSKDKHVAGLFADCNDLEDDNGAVRSRVKKGLFRTVAQRHKEQLASLMNQLHSTHPHFVRCILPNHKKRPKQFSAPLVLDQLRCNGVLEGIRIARTGFPNRLPFSEFRQRYEVLCHNMPKGYLNGKTAAQIMLERLELDKALYRVGLTKVFFRAGVLAELEERRDSLIRDIMSRFQSVARGFTQRRIVNKRLYRAEATRIIWHNLQVYVDLCNNPWWRLFVRMKPLLGATTSAGEVKKRDERIQKLETKMQKDNTERQKLEDERRRAHTEVQRIQKTLENERSLALDKEEIFKRLQHRESELSEKLAEASRTIGEIKKRDDMIQRLELKLHHESLGKKNLEDMLGQRDTEIQQLRQFSESQRSRALDEEETFQRFQRREAELTQQIGESERSFAIEKKEACQRLQQREAELSKKLADSERSFALEKAGILKQSQRREDELAEKLRESEHSLVLIKEEAFKQLQHREAELSEKLAGALEDQETLEDQLDELMNAKRKTEADLTSSLNLYKRRADEYFSKLEQAEIAVLKATRAEQTAKAQAQESGDTCLNIVAERKQMDVLVEDLQRQNQQYEAKVEDLAADLEGALQAKKRLQHELEDYRSQRATDIEDKETLMEQTRKKYQNEFLALTKELQVERENVIHARSENTRIRDELEELRSRCHDEVLNSSTWAKEKSRLELTLQDLSSSREEAVNAHNDAQARIVSLLSQLRNLRTSMDDVAAERDMLQKEKRGLETRLSEAGDRLEDLARGESPSRHNGAGMNRELLDLKSQLAQQEDVTAAAVDKMRRAETLATEMQKDVVAEREINATLHKEKAALEKTVKDLHGRVVDLETKGYSSTSQDVRFLNGRVQEVIISSIPLFSTFLPCVYILKKQPTNSLPFVLPPQLEHQIEAHESKHATSLRSVRNIDRTVRDLQAQISRRDKQAQQLTNDIAKGRDKIDRLLQTVDELQAEEAQSQLAARRAERDLREEREKALRLERELEGWKGLRMERGGGKIGSGGDWSGSLRGAVSGNEWGGGGIFRTSTSTNGFCNGGKIGSAHLSGNSASAGAGAAPKSGVAERRMSDSKGFL